MSDADAFEVSNFGLPEMVLDCFQSRLGRSMKGNLALWLVLAGVPTSLCAQWVAVDPAYPAGSGPSSTVQAVALQADGRALIGGAFTNVHGMGHPYLARLNADGSVDLTFSAQLTQAAIRIQTLPENRVLIGGSFTNVGSGFCPGVARLLADGSLDTTFAPPKPVGYGSYSFDADAGGGVWVAGSFTNLGGLPCNYVARLLEDGSIDPAYHSPFTDNSSVNFLVAQPDGKAIVGGWFTNFAGVRVTNLVRLNVDGSPDPTFQSGLAPGQRITRGVLLPDGRLAAAVLATGDYGMPLSGPSLVRLNAEGALDPTFSVSFDYPGILPNGGIYAMVALPDGKLLVSGTFLRANGVARGRLARILSDGTLDYCFDVALDAEWYPMALAVDKEGGVIAGGSFAGLDGQFRPELLRLLPSDGCASGVIQVAVTTQSVRRDEPALVVPLVRQGGADQDQSVEFSTVDGSAQGGVDYVSTNGTLHFARGERSQSIRIPLLYSASSRGPRDFQVRLNQVSAGAALGTLTNLTVTLTDAPAGTAGAADTNYLVLLDGPVQLILPLENGGALITGGFTNVNRQLCPNLARLKADGTLDTGFVRAQPLDGEIRAAAFDAAGRLLVAGYFQHVNGLWRPGLARFGTDGSVDASFAPFDGWQTNEYGGVQLESVAVLTDGSIVCGGSVPTDTSYDYHDTLLKLSPAGVLDPAFTNRFLMEVETTKLRALPDGGFLMQGEGLGSSLMRFHADGSINFDFLPSADLENAYYAGDFALMTNGQVTVGTSGEGYYSLADLPPLYRLNPDGSTDSGLSLSNLLSPLGTLQGVNALSVAMDGRVLLAGEFSTTNSYSYALQRLHADGSVDWGFAQSGSLKAAPDGSISINAMVPLGAGGWLVGGDFGGCDGFNQNYLVKILPENTSRPLAFAFAVSNVTVVETNATLSFEVHRSGDASGASGVTVFTADGSAVGGQDYQPVNTTLTFGPGEWSKTITLNLLDDHLVEGTEQFSLCLTNATGGFSLGAPASIRITILDNDTTVDFITNTFHAFEEDGYALIGVKWNGQVSSNSSAVIGIVPVIGSSADLGIASVKVQYGMSPSLGNTNWFRVPIVDDARHETTRQFQLAVAQNGNIAPGAHGLATLLIDDLDYDSSPSRGVSGVVEAMAASPQGGVYLAGDFTGVHGVARSRVARLQEDGEVDPGFDPGAGPNDDVSAMAVQTDGKVLIAGRFSAIGTVPRAGLARLNPDGSLDPTFDPGLGAQSTNGVAFVDALLPQNNGCVVVGGAFTHFNGQYGPEAARLHADGSVDGGFKSPFIQPSSFIRPYPPLPTFTSPPVVYGLAARPDGDVLAVGQLNVTNYSSQVAAVSLTQTGQLNGGFGSPPGGARSMALTSNGRILIGGLATNTTVVMPHGTPPWVRVSRFTTNGALDSGFVVVNLPTNSWDISEIRQLLVQPDGRIVFLAGLYTLVQPAPLGTATYVLDRAVIGRLQANGQWDSTFGLLTCALPLLQQTGPFWFNLPGVQLPSMSASIRPPLPAAALVRQPDGVLVVGGAFDSVNGQPRRRLARVDATGWLRGRLVLGLSGGVSPQLILPAEVETPYVIQSSTDLVHWSDWLADDYPWWSVELGLTPSEPVRFFRARSSP